MHFRSLKKTSQEVSFSDPIDTDKDGNALTLSDIVSDSSDVAEETSTKIQLEKLRKILPIALDKREKDIIYMRYGLYGEEELTQQQIAEKLKISRSYVYNIG